MLPLEDIRVVDFSQRLPGPYCSSILADMGAEVLVVERAGSPPESRSVFPGLFELVNRNKRSITVDLKQEEGKSIARALIKRSDVLIEEFRPGVAARLGIGFGSVKQINPAIIYCSISGFGQDGPYRDRVGHDINYLSLSGILSIPGQPETAPSRPGVPMVDLASGMYAAIAILAALRKREMGGEGDYIDVSMFDTMISWMSVRAARLLIQGEEPANEHLSPLNNIYETRDGEKISLGLLEENFWRNFCCAAGREELLEDPRFSSSAGRKANASDLLHILRAIVRERTAEEWEQCLDWRQVPFARVHGIKEAIGDPHLRARALVQEIETPDRGKIQEVVFPVKCQGLAGPIRRPPPAWGEHTTEVLRELGYSDGEIASLREKSAI